MTENDKIKAIIEELQQQNKSGFIIENDRLILVSSAVEICKKYLEE